MNILAFDTCLDKMYVAVGNQNGVLHSKIVETTEEKYHSAYLISTITELVEKAGLAPFDIDVVATNIGPGSFTGIRACTTVARVMAQATNAKTIGVSSLEVLSKINDTDKKTLVALDARKEMAYVALFESGRAIFKAKAVLLEELKKMIRDEDYFIVTDDKLKPLIGGVSYQNQTYDLGAVLLKTVGLKLKNEEVEVDTSWQNLQPLYIQPPALHVKKTV